MEIESRIYERIGYDEKNDGPDIRALNIPERTVYVVTAMESEVNRGGFHQYFFNSSGNYAEDALNALHCIRATQTADLLQKVMRIFPDKSIPITRRERWALLDAMETPSSSHKIAALRDLDSEFYQRGELVTVLLVSYVKENMTSFS